MTKSDFRILAAGFYLSGNEDVEEMVESLFSTEAAEIGEIPDDVIIWQPFEDYELEEIIELILTIEQEFERVYKLGQKSKS